MTCRARMFLLLMDFHAGICSNAMMGEAALALETQRRQSRYFSCSVGRLQSSDANSVTSSDHSPKRCNPSVHCSASVSFVLTPGYIRWFSAEVVVSAVESDVFVTAIRVGRLIICRSAARKLLNDCFAASIAWPWNLLINSKDSVQRISRSLHYVL